MEEPRKLLLKRSVFIASAISALRALPRRYPTCQRVMYFKSVPSEGGVKSRYKI